MLQKLHPQGRSNCMNPSSEHQHPKAVPALLGPWHQLGSRQPPPNTQAPPVAASIAPAAEPSEWVLLGQVLQLHANEERWSIMQPAASARHAKALGSSGAHSQQLLAWTIRTVS